MNVWSEYKFKRKIQRILNMQKISSHLYDTSSAVSEISFFKYYYTVNWRAIRLKINSNKLKAIYYNLIKFTIKFIKLNTF